MARFDEKSVRLIIVPEFVGITKATKNILFLFRQQNKSKLNSKNIKTFKSN